MKLYSWNVNGLRAVLRKGALQDFIASEQPDVLCLQEIKAKPEQVELDLPDYDIFWNPAERPGYSGTATLVRKMSKNNLSEGGPELRRGLARDTRDDGLSRRDPEDKLFCSILKEGRVLTLEFPDFYLVNVYTPNAKPDLARLDLRENCWDPKFREYLKELEKTKPVVTCGDFNAAHQEIDLARPDQNHEHAGFTDQERQGITNLLNDGFVDTFRQLHPQTQRYSWWSFRGNARANNVGWRIDYFFISKKLLPKLKDAEIYENITGSDHCPISITLDLPKEQ